MSDIEKFNTEQPFNELNFNSRIPRYNDSSDYTTNAPSYYDDLARKNKLLKTLATRIWEYDKEMYKRFKEWDQNLKDFPDDVKKLLEKWLKDGTLDHIINDTIFNWKADKEYVDNQFNNRMVIVSDYCDDLIYSVDNTAGIKQAINVLKTTGLKHLHFTEGIYSYSDKLEISDIPDLKITFNKNALLYDQGKEVMTVQGLKQAPNGFLIENVKDVDIEFRHDSVLPSDTSPVENPDDRVPHLKLKKIDKLKLHDSLLKSFTGVITQRSEAFKQAYVMEEYYIKMEDIDDVNIFDNELEEYAGHGEIFGVYNCQNVNFYRNKHRQLSGGNTFWSFGKFIFVNNLEIYDLDVKSNSPGSLFDGVVKNYAYIHDVNIDYAGHFFDCTNEWAGFNIDQQHYHFENCQSTGGGITSVMHHDDQSLNKRIKNLSLDNCNFGNNKPGSYYISSTMFENVTVRNTNFESVRYLFDGRGRETKPISQFDRHVKFIDCNFNLDYDVNYQMEIDVYGKTEMINCHFTSPNNANYYFKDYKRIELDITDMKTNRDLLSRLYLINCTFKDCRLHYDVNTELINTQYVNLLTMNIFAYNKPLITTITPLCHAYSKPNKNYFPIGAEIKSTNPNELGEVGGKYVITGWMKNNDGDTNEDTDWRELRALTGN